MITSQTHRRLREELGRGGAQMKEAVVVQGYVEREERNAFQRIADDEKRSISSLLRVVICDYLVSRNGKASKKGRGKNA